MDSMYSNIGFAALWLIIAGISINMALMNIELVTDPQEQYKLYANFGMLITTVSIAMLLYYLKELANKK